MPVSNISTLVDCSVNSGAERWMGILSSVSIGPMPSTGWPMTFIIRPSTASPTGTVIRSPVSVTSISRTRPSVASMAMVLTVLSPRWEATSSTRLSASSLIAGLVTVSALRIAGTWPAGNTTSTTAPIIWLILPTLLPLPISCLFSSEYCSALPTR